MKNFPRPVKNDGSFPVKLYTTSEWFAKLNEELDEAKYNAAVADEIKCSFLAEAEEYRANLAEELADLMTCCVSWLDVLGYDEEKRSKLFAEVNEKNEQRGYFDEYPRYFSHEGDDDK